MFGVHWFLDWMLNTIRVNKMTPGRPSTTEALYMTRELPSCPYGYTAWQLKCSSCFGKYGISCQENFF
jgi:hypothetical protein